MYQEGERGGVKGEAQGEMNRSDEGAPMNTTFAKYVHPSLPLLMGVAGTSHDDVPFSPPSLTFPPPSPPPSQVPFPLLLPVPLLCSAGGSSSTKFSASSASRP